MDKLIEHGMLIIAAIFATVFVSKNAKMHERPVKSNRMKIASSQTTR
jgi:hypothetical protein